MGKYNTVNTFVTYNWWPWQPITIHRYIFRGAGGAAVGGASKGAAAPQAKLEHQ